MQIKQILIKDSPSFKSLDLCFHQGLNVISGASGAGKSVFFASLLALFGLKECNAKIIEGFLDGEIELFEYLSEEELNVQILKKDKTRYFLNHQSTSKKRLGEIFAPYVKFLSHKNSNELESSFLLDVLDSEIECKTHQQSLRDYQESFLEFQKLQAELQILREESKKLVELKEFALFEIEKITNINPRLGEYEELLEFKKMLSKKEKLQALGAEAMEALSQMSKVSAFLEALGQKIEGYDEVMMEVEAKVEDEMQKLQELEDQDPEKVLDRLSQLSSLISRYGGIGEALEYLKEQQKKLEGYENMEGKEQELCTKLEALHTRLQSLANQISKTRFKSLPHLQERLSSYASSLLLNAVRLDLMEGGLNAIGCNEIVITLNDSSVQTLSSGEYNRLRLAVLALQGKKNAGILLLDEIDANLSGEESEGVARVLKQLSQNYQVFAISHQPHLPSMADAHFVVQKTSEESQMRELDKEGRIQEIARMISGASLSKEALEFARKKIEG